MNDDVEDDDDDEEEEKKSPKAGSDWLGYRSSVNEEEGEAETAADKHLEQITDSQGRKKFKV